MQKQFTNDLIAQLNLSNDLKDKITSDLQNTSLYKLKPYINLLKNNDSLFEIIKNKQITNKWEAVLYLYRYNIKLALSLYPYICILETILKTRINNRMIEAYSDYWFKDEVLFLKVNEITNMIDISIYNKYKNVDITRTIEKAIIEDYYLINDQLDRLSEPKIAIKQIDKSVKHIKRSAYIYREKEKAIAENRTISCMNFVDNKTTLGYWLSILKISNLWKDPANLKNIFKEGVSKNKVETKLETIRILRNKIAHYSQIIGKNQIKNTNNQKVSLIDVYHNMQDIFAYLDIDTTDIMELMCNNNDKCNKRSFTILYNELPEIHEAEIIPEKANPIATSINMQEIHSSYFKKVGYDKKERVLEVEFNQGEIYQYYSVPEHYYTKMLDPKTKSKGQYFIKYIRDDFVYNKIN